MKPNAQSHRITLAATQMIEGGSKSALVTMYRGIREELRLRNEAFDAEYADEDYMYDPAGCSEAAGQIQALTFVLTALESALEAAR